MGEGAVVVVEDGNAVVPFTDWWWSLLVSSLSAITTARGRGPLLTESYGGGGGLV